MKILLYKSSTYTANHQNLTSEKLRFIRICYVRIPLYVANHEDLAIQESRVDLLYRANHQNLLYGNLTYIQDHQNLTSENFVYTANHQNLLCENPALCSKS